MFVHFSILHTIRYELIFLYERGQLKFLCHIDLYLHYFYRSLPYSDQAFVVACIDFEFFALLKFV
ncbi:hypothetical protein T11_10894 [Trichinella zimbabwensis]|uniref:Uncharacterized protein n=1 Tax=Trichinella zimbabwensis TaxID=268475 RepID=A0A0V1GL71_9BILA|nr:hypothetical protein T11_10894 [Trichinella zimbabwensis]